MFLHKHFFTAEAASAQEDFMASNSTEDRQDLEGM